MKKLKIPTLCLAFLALTGMLKASPRVTDLTMSSYTASSLTYSVSASDESGALYSIDFYVMNPDETDWTFVENITVSSGASACYSGNATFTWSPSQYGVCSIMAVPHDLWDAYPDGEASTSINFVPPPPPLPATGGSFSTSANPVVGRSYEVYADNIQNATRVVFATWTEANGQDDIIWYEGEYVGYYNRWKRRVRLSEHNNESGNYTTHVYAQGTDGQWYCLYGLTVNATYVPLPVSVNLSSQFPVPRDQGTVQASCVPFAATYARTYQLAKKWGWSDVNDPNVQLSPGYVYDQIVLPDGFSNLSDALSILKYNGCDTLSDYPYRAIGQDFNDAYEVLNYCRTELGVRKPPSAAQHQNAARFKTDGFSWYNITDDTVDGIKSALAKGDPVIIGIKIQVPDSSGDNLENLIGIKWVWHPPEIKIKWYGVVVIPGFYGPGYYLRTRYVDHAVCVVGYDDSRGTLLCIDSLTINYNLIRNLVPLLIGDVPVADIPGNDVHACIREIGYQEPIYSATVLTDN